MARPKAVKSAAELEQEAAQLLEQAKMLRLAQVNKAGELVKELHEKGFAGFDLEQFKAKVEKIFKG